MITSATRYLDVPARLLLAAIFVLAGLGKLSAPENTLSYMQSFGLPGILFYPTIVFEIGAGLLLTVGLQARVTAFLLAGFTIMSGLVFHSDFGDQTQSIMLLKNMSIAGGLLMLTKHGSEHFTIDALLARRGKTR